MKLILAIAFSLSLFTTSVGVFATQPEGKSVHVISAKQKNLFVFKANKNWRGASVEVIDKNGECISCQKLNKHKMIIDFKYVKPGNYSILISKADQVQKFQYTKN